MNCPEPGEREHAPPRPESLLTDLTPEQAQAVTHDTGPLLILAGPGAGKTKTLTHRAAYLLATGRAQPWEILRSRSASERRANCGCGWPSCPARRSREACSPRRFTRYAHGCSARTAACSADRALHDLRPG